MMMIPTIAAATPSSVAIARSKLRTSPIWLTTMPSESGANALATTKPASAETPIGVRLAGV